MRGSSNPACSEAKPYPTDRAAERPTRSVPDWMRVSSNPACSEAKPYPTDRAAERPFIRQIRERTSQKLRYAVAG